MSAASLIIRMTAEKGRGLFAADDIPRGARLVEMLGDLCAAEDLPEDCLAMQVGDDLWLHSPGDSLDDCGNHSCDPNAGFTTGAPVLFALRDIVAGEEICWDYSTSMSWPEWSLECRCGAKNCRGVILPWPNLPPEVRDRLKPIALAYLRSESAPFRA